MQLSPGARVRSFEVLGPLGAGGMGAVYRARDGKLGRDVAIKILQDDLSGNREYLHRFEREARAASALNHPNIITIFEINEFEGAPFIAMELVEGMSLRQLLKKGAVPIRKLLDVAAQIADGLASAHERGIVHRDLKPENVMLTHDGRVKILDFGLARIHRHAASNDPTSELSAVRTPEGRIIGTASYVSPEQASGGRFVDYRSDQFSFGSLLYELATARRAFERGTVVETLAAIMREEPEPAQRVNPRLPPPLCWIIERCLSKDPSDRYASTSDLARELRTLRDRLPETSPGSLRRPARWSVRARAGGIAALVIAAVIAIVSASHRLGSRAPQLPNQKYLAVLPFTDLSARADGPLFSQGFSDAVSSRLAKYSGVQVISPASSAPLVAKKSSFKRVAQELGATLLLSASVQRAGDSLRVSYSIVDPNRGASIAGDSINGSIHNIWAVQDAVADGVARDLDIQQPRPPTKNAGLDTAEEQDLYVRALGALDQPNDEKSVQKAIDMLRELTESASNCALVQAALGRAYLAEYTITYDKNWSDRAIKACDRARVLDPDAPDVLLTVANVDKITGRYEEAIATFKRALSLQPNSAEAAIGLGETYAGTQQMVAAEQAFRRGIALRPTWWYGYNKLGIIYLSEARWSDAAKEFEAVIRLNPENSFGYANLGAVAFATGDLKNAIAKFEKAASLGATSAYSNLGDCYYFLGDYDKSVSYHRRAIALGPSIPTRWANFADACSWSRSCLSEADGAYRKAVELLQRDLSVNPKNARAHGTLAVCLAKLGKKADAQAEVQRALELDPKNPLRMFQAARVANAFHDDEGAIKWLERALTTGYQKFEVERDPEFARLRASSAYRTRIDGMPVGP